MQLAAIINNARNILERAVETYTWDDDLLLSFANRAIKQACIRKNLLFDTTFHLTTVANQSLYLLDSSIYNIADIYDTHQHKFLHRASYRDKDVKGFPLSTPNTPISHYIVDYKYNYVGLYPTPTTSNVKCIMQAYYTPADIILITDVPPIDTQHHIYLIDYIVYLALDTLKTQTSYVDLANYHLDLFTLHFGPESILNDKYMI